MLIEHKNEDWIVITTHHVCAHHKKQPLDRAWPGCTCNSSYELIRKTD